MARPQGAGISADPTGRRAFDPNCSKVRFTISTLLCIHLRWCWTSHRSRPTDSILFFLLFSLFTFHSGPGALAEGRQEETSQWARQCSRETLLYPHSFSFFFPPVSCLVGWGIVQHFLSKRSLCPGTTLLAAQWPNSAATTGPAVTTAYTRIFFCLYRPGACTAFTV